MMYTGRCEAEMDDKADETEKSLENNPEQTGGYKKGYSKECLGQQTYRGWRKWFSSDYFIMKKQDPHMHRRSRRKKKANGGRENLKSSTQEGKQIH